MEVLHHHQITASWLELRIQEPPAGGGNGKTPGPHRRSISEGVGLVVAGEKRLDFLPKCLVAGAGLHQEGIALFGVALQVRIVDLLELMPTLGIHPCSPPFSSLSSHTFASRQSRKTLSGETLSI